MSQKYIFPIFWVLLAYIVAAIVWWGISLEEQNRELFIAKTQNQYLDRVSFHKVKVEREKKTFKYIGEGVVSVLVVLLGAGILYSLLRRMMHISHKEKNFILAISHELKTPLASVQLNLETLQKRNIPEPTKQQLIGSALQEVKRLDTLYTNILTTSRFDAGKTLKKNFQVIQLAPLLYHIVGQFQNSFPNYTFSLNDRSQRDLQIKGDRHLIHLLFYNLIDNAVKYSPQENPHIYINLYDDLHNVYVSVKDEGIGISAVNSKYIFKKFFRIQDENTRHTKGTGLGLYIVQQTLDLHSASIKVRQNKPRGSIFITQFKKKI